MFITPGGPGAALIGTYTWSGRDTEARISSNNNGHSLQWNNGFQQWVFEQGIGGQWRENTSGKGFVLSIEAEPQNPQAVIAVVVHRQDAGQNATNGTRWERNKAPESLPLPGVPIAARCEPVVQRAASNEDEGLPQFVSSPSRQAEMRLSLDDRAAGLSSSDVSPIGVFNPGGMSTMEERAQFSVITGAVIAKPPRLVPGSVSDPRLVNFSADLTGMSKLSLTDDDDDQSVEALFAPAIPAEGGCKALLRIVSTGSDAAKTTSLHKAPDMLFTRPSCAFGIWFANGSSIMLSDLGDLMSVHDMDAKTLAEGMIFKSGDALTLTIDREACTLTVEIETVDTNLKNAQCTVDMQDDQASCKAKLSVSLTRPGAHVQLEHYERW